MGYAHAISTIASGDSSLVYFVYQYNINGDGRRIKY